MNFNDTIMAVKSKTTTTFGESKHVCCDGILYTFPIILTIKSNTLSHMDIK